MPDNRVKLIESAIRVFREAQTQFEEEIEPVIMSNEEFLSIITPITLDVLDFRITIERR